MICYLLSKIFIILNEFSYTERIHMTRIFTYNIDMNYSSIEEFLRQKGYSHHIMTHLKRTERGIVHNGDWAYSSAALVPGDRLVITLTEDACSENILPAPVPFEIVYEDEDLMIINKPSNTPVHPSVNNYGNTQMCIRDRISSITSEPFICLLTCSIFSFCKPAIYVSSCSFDK